MDPTSALWDWRRRTADLFRAANGGGEAAWHTWRAGRDEMFRTHDQSPLDASRRADFRALPFFPYDPARRFAVDLQPVSGPAVTVALGADGDLRRRPFARTLGLAAALGAELTLFWLEGYGGGVFLPFADASTATYGGGRYLLDTIKGADLGSDAQGRTVLDFNFAYNPSCCYSERYVCPLAPVENRLPNPVTAGECDYISVSNS